MKVWVRLPPGPPGGIKMRCEACGEYLIDDMDYCCACGHEYSDSYTKNNFENYYEDDDFWRDDV